LTKYNNYDKSGQYGCYDMPHVVLGYLIGKQWIFKVSPSGTAKIP